LSRNRIPEYRRIETFGRYLKREYGKKVVKIPIGLSGFTCPNIDGTVARGGCTFCLNESFSPNLASGEKRIHLNLSTPSNPILDRQLRELDEQIRTTRERMRVDYGAEKFLVYFQSFTNTYAPFETPETLYLKALEYDDVIGLSIGTRSDCVEERVLRLLSEISRDKEVWIEFGIQSVFDETLERINRGHDALNVREAIERSKAHGLDVCGHLIFGLPGENREMMIESAKRAYEWGIDSVKYHPLYVVKNTLLANEYRRGEFSPISMEEYIETLIEAISLKPENISVQRVTAGIDDDTLLAPQWCGWSKNRVMGAIRDALAKAGYIY